MTAAWMLTFWLFAVGWFCCCTPAETLCIRCTDDTNTISVTIGNVVDGTCDCSAIDTTFILTRLPDALCTWRQLGSFNCTLLGSVGYSVQAGAISGLGGNYMWTCTLKLDWTGFGLAEILWLWDSGDDVAFDCTSTQTLAVNSYTSPTPTICADWPDMTCQVN